MSLNRVEDFFIADVGSVCGRANPPNRMAAAIAILSAPRLLD
jgi:hypothetical protein